MPHTVRFCALTVAVEGRKAEAPQMLAAVNTDVLDGHTELRLGETSAMAGATARAPALVEQGVARNVYPCDVAARYSPFLKLFRGGAELERMLATAKRRTRALRR